MDIEFLEELKRRTGHVEVPKGPPGSPLKGPFTSRLLHAGLEQYEIVDSDHRVRIWAKDRKTVKELLTVLNLAFEHGRFFK